jgi:hypothetical protein
VLQYRTSALQQKKNFPPTHHIFLYSLEAALGGLLSASVFVCALIDAIEWPDVRFPFDHFRRGHDILGDMPDTGIWRLKSAEEIEAERLAQTSVRDLSLENWKWNHDLARSLATKLKRARALEAAGDHSAMNDIRAIHEATLKERLLGQAEIITRTECNSRFGGSNGWRADERFVVHQGPKIRPCENCRRSGKNATVF